MKHLDIDDIITEAKELRKGGLSYQKIADQFGIHSGETVHYWIDPEYRAHRLAYRKSYYSENREAAIAYRKKYGETHKEETRAYKKEYNKNNRDKLRISEKAYRDEHKKEYCEHVRARRDKIGCAEAINKDQYEKIWQEQNCRCFYCGKLMSLEGSQYSVDRCNIEHINPISNGGWHELSNIVLACRECNYSKNTKLVEDWKPEILPKIAANPRLNYNIEEAHMRWLV